MEAAFYLFVLGAITGFTEAAGILPDGPLNAPVGGSVMFTTSLTEADGPFLGVTWSFNTTFFIISYQSGSSLIPPAYQDRITFFPSTASLELKYLTLDDGGEYSVTVFPDRGGRIKLDIYVPVSSVTVTPQSADLVEFSSFSLTCSSSGSSLSFIWMNSSSDVTSSDRVQITDGGSTLTVVDVTRYDEQSYRCRVFNPVSEGISDPVNILVSYGPENVHLTVFPSQGNFEEGSNITLKCSADCRPSAQLMWFLNGAQLPDFGAEPSLMNFQMNQSGSYNCHAYNPRTMKYQTSQFVNISLRKSEGLSANVIAGIVIGCLSILINAVAIGYYFIVRRKTCKVKKRSSTTGPRSSSQPGAAEVHEDHDYVNIDEILRR